jgi:hypothetical protein
MRSPLPVATSPAFERALILSPSSFAK